MNAEGLRLGMFMEYRKVVRGRVDHLTFMHEGRGEERKGEENWEI